MGRKNFRALCAMAIKVARLKKRRPGRKKEVRKKMAEKGPINFSRFMRHGTRGDQVENGRKRRPGRKKEARLKKGGQE